MATVASVTLDLPSSDPAIDEGLTFAMQGDVADALHGGMDYDMHWQYDQGTGTWIDIPSSGSELTTADTNPAASLVDEVEHTITVTGAGAGTYSVRVQTVDNNEGGATDTSGTQTVTVSAVASSRRVFIT